MKLRYLGTAAAEGFPALFCQCEACQRAAAAKGRNIRTRSQALVDDQLLIDFPPDTYMHMLHLDVPLPQIKNCLITHAHGDHLYPADFGMRGTVFAILPEKDLLTVYGTAPTGDRLLPEMEIYGLRRDERVEFCEIRPFEPFAVQEYTVTALTADHHHAIQSVFYRIDNGECSLLYAHDTGMFPEETMDYLKASHKKLDFVSLDCTTGIHDSRSGHMGFAACCDMKRLLIENGCANEETIFCVNHFSHNGGVTYDELVPIAQEKGFLVSYDGMSVEF